MEDRGPAVVGCGHRPSVAGRTASGKTGLAERTQKPDTEEGDRSRHGDAVQFHD
jgi:hypothetical protein